MFQTHHGRVSDRVPPTAFALTQSKKVIYAHSSSPRNGQLDADRCPQCRQSPSPDLREELCAARGVGRNVQRAAGNPGASPTRGLPAAGIGRTNDPPRGWHARDQRTGVLNLGVKREPDLKKRIFVVEDQPAVREGIVESINRETDLSICGEADDLPAALVAIASACPDLVLTDLQLKSSQGVELIRELRRQYPALPIVGMTTFDPVGHERQARAAGATGFAVKQEGPGKLIAALRAALQE